VSVTPLKTSADLKKLGTILSFWAHPDDETFACAGIMATAVKNGQQVICVTATRGEEGVQDEVRWPKARLPEIRTRELKDALQILDVTEHFFLKYRDGMLDRVSLDEGAGQVTNFIRKYRPDSILTFGPEGWTGHPDHQSISHWVTYALKTLEHPPRLYHWVQLEDNYKEYMLDAHKRFNIYFNIAKPPLINSKDCDLCFSCDDALCFKKCAALAAMPSQMERIMKQYDQATLLEMFRPEAFVRVK
jgi:LmbE family N-acetylglucosaminyl deacetylase